MFDYYIVSQRQTRSTPAQGCLIEFEDVIAHCCQGRIITPRLNPPKLLTQNTYSVEIPPRRTQDKQILLIIDLELNGIPQVLGNIPNWRSRFDIVCAYIFDAFIPKTEYDKPQWKRNLSPFSRAIASLDHLFIPMTSNVKDFQELYNIPVSVIPMACDVRKFGRGDANRFIDVIGYGRQNPEHSRIFANVYNDPQSERMYYHTDHMQIAKIHNFYEHRSFFWKILSRSRIALAYDALKVDPNKRFPFSFVGQRWFESITAGCVIVGQKPTCPEMEELFFWEDATIELPENSWDIIPFTEALLADKKRLEAAYRRNVEKAISHHDWRHRLAQIHQCLKLPLPEILRKELIS
jgi:hypothetical protein